MRLFSVILIRTTQMVLVLLALAAALWVLWSALCLTLPDDVSAQVRAAVRQSLGLARTVPPRLPQVVNDASADHKMVADWVRHCMGSPAQRQFTVESQMLLEGFSLHPHLTLPDAGTLPLAALYTRALNLSTALFWKRWNNDEKRVDAERKARVGAYAAILVGFLTTLCVGLNAMGLAQEGSALGIRLKVAALALPALGTAIAAVTAFDDPAGAFARQHQAALGMQQLHDQIATASWKLPCAASATEPVPDDAERSLEAWSLRLRDLASSAGDAQGQAEKHGQQAGKDAPAQ